MFPDDETQNMHFLKPRCISFKMLFFDKILHLIAHQLFAHF